MDVMARLVQKNVKAHSKCVLKIHILLYLHVILQNMYIYFSEIRHL